MKSPVFEDFSPLDALIVVTYTNNQRAPFGCSTLFSHLGVGLLDKTAIEHHQDIIRKRKVDEIKDIRAMAFAEMFQLPALKLQLLDEILRSVRGVDEFFGGIQCIFEGDYLQYVFGSINRPGSNEEDVEHIWQTKAFKEANFVYVRLDHNFRAHGGEEESDDKVDFARGILLLRSYCPETLGDEERLQTFREVKAFIDSAPSAEGNGYTEFNDVQALCCTRRKAREVSAVRRGALPGDDIDVSARIRTSGRMSAEIGTQSDAVKKAFEEKTGMACMQVLKVGEKVIITGRIGDKARNGDRGSVKSVKWTTSSDKFVSTITVTIPSGDVSIERVHEKVLVPQAGGTFVEHTFLYFPVIAAKCITIARAQGIEILQGPYHVILDHVYQHGMILVALSRSNCLPSIDFCNKLITERTLFANKNALEFDKFCEKKTLELLQAFT